MIKHHNGHSLLELLAAVTIVGILMALVVPNFSHLRVNQDSKHLKMTVMSMLSRAQQIAHTAKTTIGICHSQDARQCSAEAASYLLMFYDESGNGIIQHASQVIEVTDLSKETGRIKWVFYPAYRHYIQFRPAFAYFTDNGRIGFYRHEVNKPVWELVLNQAGNVRESG